MPVMSRWKARFRALFNREALDRDFDRELSAWAGNWKLVTGS
jgi:hypothetical protein